MPTPTDPPTPHQDDPVVPPFHSDSHSIYDSTNRRVASFGFTGHPISTNLPTSDRDHILATCLSALNNPPEPRRDPHDPPTPPPYDKRDYPNDPPVGTRPPCSTRPPTLDIGQTLFNTEGLSSSEVKSYISALHLRITDHITLRSSGYNTPIADIFPAPFPSLIEGLVKANSPYFNRYSYLNKRLVVADYDFRGPRTTSNPSGFVLMSCHNGRHLNIYRVERS